jgi:hypothetical protein
MGNLALLIPIIGMSIPLFAIWTKHLQKVAEIQARNTVADNGERDAATVGKVEALEERVRVLERIVTDGGYTVAAQIEALRDDRSGQQGAGAPLAPSKEHV